MEDNGLRLFSQGDKNFVSIKVFNSEAIYPLKPVQFQKKAEAILMDLDGTTLDSEEFWVYILERTIRELLKSRTFSFEDSDIPFVSGYTTVEHLKYCIKKYCEDKQLSDALMLYHSITEQELAAIQNGTGNMSAFKPKPDLKFFLTELKAAGVKIGLATSGLEYKAIPEINAVFKQIGLGDPLNFYDSIITGGRRKDVRQYGTLGEVVSKPHPFIYTELAYMGLKVINSQNVLGIEDSSAGVLAVRLAGFPVIGLNSGNIGKSGFDYLCHSKVNNLSDILKIIL